MPCLARAAVAGRSAKDADPFTVVPDQVLPAPVVSLAWPCVSLLSYLQRVYVSGRGEVWGGSRPVAGLEKNYALSSPRFPGP